MSTPKAEAVTGERTPARDGRLDTRIPEQRKVQGLIYGAHIGRPMEGWSGYYVRLIGSDKWAVARLTPASDELPGDGTDEDIVNAIKEELGE